MPDAKTTTGRVPSHSEIYSGMAALDTLRWVASKAQDEEALWHLQVLTELIAPIVGRTLDRMHAALEHPLGGHLRVGLFDDEDSETDDAAQSAPAQP